MLHDKLKSKSSFSPLVSIPQSSKFSSISTSSCKTCQDDASEDYVEIQFKPETEICPLNILQSSSVTSNKSKGSPSLPSKTLITNYLSQKANFPPISSAIYNSDPHSSTSFGYPPLALSTYPATHLEFAPRKPPF